MAQKISLKQVKKVSKSANAAGLSGPKKDTTNTYHIHYGNKKQAVGYIQSYPAQHIRITVNDRYRNKGIATEAHKQFINSNPEQVFYAYVNEHNDASMRSIEKSGVYNYKGKVSAYKSKPS